MNKQILLFFRLSVIGSVLLLSACVSYVPAPVSTAQTSSMMPMASLSDCQHAPFLITNLQLPENERNYLLANGKLCPNSEV